MGAEPGRSPADVVAGPLMEALEKLSIAVDPVASSHDLLGESSETSK